MTLNFHPDGSITTLHTDALPLAELGRVTRTRYSHILPVHPLKRAAFRALRWLFGDTSRAAAWTRTWRGPWQATIVTTGATFTHPDRAACIAWEHSQFDKA